MRAASGSGFARLERVAGLAVDDDLRDGAVAAADHRLVHRHGFEQDAAERLRRDRRVHGDVHEGQVVGDVGRVAGEEDVRLERAVGDQRAGCGPCRRRHRRSPCRRARRRRPARARRIAGSARIRISWPFHWRMLPTTPITGRSGARPSAARTSAAGRAGDHFGRIEAVRDRVQVAGTEAVRQQVVVGGARDAEDRRQPWREQAGREREAVVDAPLVHDARNAREPCREHPVVGTGDRVVQVQQVGALAAEDAGIARGGHEEQERVQSALHQGQRQQQRHRPAGAAEARGEAERRRLGHEAGRRGPLEPAPERVLALEDHHRLVAACDPVPARGRAG